MRANIVFNDDGYVFELTYQEDGEYELPDNFDEIILGCYKLSDGKVVLDVNKDEYKKHEISLLEIELSKTDEEMLGFLEDFFSLKNPLTFISDLFNLMKNYSMLVVARQQIRQKIKELQK